MTDLHRLIPFKPLLWMLSAVGFFGLNGVFIYYAFAHPDVMAAAQANPVSLVFMVEAFFLVAFGAWFVHRLGYRRPGWIAFVVYSIVGSLAFSVPFFLLSHVLKVEKE